MTEALCMNCGKPWGQHLGDKSVYGCHNWSPPTTEALSEGFCESCKRDVLSYCSKCYGRLLAENKRLRDTVELLKGYVGDEMVRSDFQTAGHMRKALNAERAENERLKMQEQKDVDSICHYRNLACSLGAKPEDMLNDHDKRLARDWPTMDHSEGWHNDAPDCWDQLEQAEARVAELEKALEEWQQHHNDFHAYCSVRR